MCVLRLLGTWFYIYIYIYILGNFIILQLRCETGFSNKKKKKNVWDQKFVEKG